MNLLKQAQQTPGLGLSTNRVRSAKIPNKAKEKALPKYEITTVTYDVPHNERVAMLSGEEPRPVCLRRGQRSFYTIEDMEKYKDTEYVHGMRQHLYTGSIRSDTKVREGFGAYYYATGESYHGMWVNNLRHGVGDLITPTGYIYLGQWKEDKASGKGQERFPKGEVYIGELQNGKPHGQGILWYVNHGSRYEGTFESGKRSGEGTMWYRNGDVFMGTWVQGQRNGTGYTKYGSNGRVYVSEWKNDQCLHALVFVPASKIHFPAPRATEGCEPYDEWRACEELGFPVTLPNWNVPLDTSELPELHFRLLKHAFERADAMCLGSISLEQLRQIWHENSAKAGPSSEELLNVLETKLEGVSHASVDLAELIIAWYPSLPVVDLKRYMTLDITPENLLRLRGGLAGVPSPHPNKGYTALIDLYNQTLANSNDSSGVSDVDANELTLDMLRRNKFMIGGLKFTELMFQRSNSVTEKNSLSFIDALEIWFPHVPWQRLVQLEITVIPECELDELKEDFDQLDVDRCGFLSLERFKQAQLLYQTEVANNTFQSVRSLGGQTQTDIHRLCHAGFFRHEATWKVGSIDVTVRLLKAIDIKGKYGWIGLVELLRYCFPNVPCLSTRERLGVVVSPDEVCRCCLCTYCGGKYTKVRPPSPYNEYVAW